MGRRKGNKVRLKSDKEMELDANREENFSIGMIILVLILCFAVGIGLGVILYDLAINSSSALIMKNILNFRNY